MSPKLPLAVTAALGFLASAASAVQLTSFENALDGWSINVAENAAYQFNGFSTTNGVTDGSFSAIVTGTANPSYGQMLVGPSSTGLTALLSTADSVLIDVTTQAGDFGFGTQWTAVINNPDLGYTSLDGFSYTGFVGPGASGSLTWNITPAQRATLAGSAAASTLIFQVGGGGPGTMFVDNIRVGVVIPEGASATLAAAALAGACLASRRKLHA